jgi:hypothetical protein
MRFAFVLCGIFLVMSASLHAQDEQISLLTDSIDPDTGAVSLMWVDLPAGTQRPITTLTSTSFCTPQVDMTGQRLLFEPFVPGETAFVYEIDLSDGDIVPLDVPGQQQLGCPAVNPGQPSVAWLHPAQGGDEIIVTNPDGSNPIRLAQHNTIYDQLWSPDGDILIYTAIDDDQTFRPLYSHQNAVTRFWPRDAGLVVDYVWLPDSSALLVAYYTQTQAVIGKLPRACITTTDCVPMPLATFDINAGMMLTSAFSPDASQVIVIEEQSISRGDLQSELYSVDIVQGGQQRLTNSPNVIKTSVIWLDDIYFVGGRFDVSTFAFSASAIYRLDEESREVDIAYQAEGYYPVQIIWAMP